ncbi:ABC transporter permease [Microbacterium sp. SYP-A9085]|uniref:ABC transporter permease n=1 Tax=Microbacterium sp. SYP-A9085 TaxID=2664454 RepID=UPI00129B8F55|nr:ABC transporter permease [Microbacterium sp. SYP-A9085]MRH28960.1 ABC transporter permease [Microbacterium sp. SYP-A9085]
MSDRVPGAGPEPTGLPPEQLPTASGPLTGQSARAERPPAEAGGHIPPPPRSNQLMREILRGSVVTTVLAIVASMIVGGILIAATDETVQATAGYFFARPQDMLAAVWHAVSGGYYALFQGSIVNPEANSFVKFIRPLTNTLGFAAPLIAAGLGVALAFRAGLFNIGARGQMLVACAAAAMATFSLDLPLWIHMPLTLLAGIAGGAIWGGIAGLLKARTGAHEVILTIMLNFVALYLIRWLIRTPHLLQKPGTNQPISAPTPESAQFPSLLGEQFPLLNWGFPIVVIATLIVWWLIERSTLGFRLRAVGENPHAARAAGISVQRMYVYAMLLAGGLAGMAGMNQILGSVPTGFGDGIDAGIGFDAITVALLGRSRAWGTFWAGLLFGALKAGSFTMQAAQSIPVDIVLVVESMIVLFIAAPPLVRAIFFLPKDDSDRSARGRAKAVRRRAAADSKAVAS